MATTLVPREEYLYLESTPWQARVEWRSKALQFIINHNTGGTIGVYTRRDGSAAGHANCQQDELLLEAAKALLEKP